LFLSAAIRLPPSGINGPCGNQERWKTICRIPGRVRPTAVQEPPSWVPDFHISCLVLRLPARPSNSASTEPPGRLIGRIQPNLPCSLFMFRFM
jgi:hypothetical protein